MTLKIGAAMVILLSVGAVAIAGGPHTPVRCWSESRTYHPMEGEPRVLKLFMDKLTIERVDAAMPENRVKSPNGAYAYSDLRAPCAPEKWSGCTNASILVFVERPYLLHLQAEEIFSLLDLKWVNEKLLYFRLAGRLAGVDVLFDVEHEKVLHSEAVDWGAGLYEQHLTSCETESFRDTEACKGPCYRLK